MEKLLLLFFTVYGLFTFIIASNTLNNLSLVEDNEDSYYPLISSSDPFDFKLFKTLSSSSNDNILVSPISLKLVLALLYEGAGGITEKEFQNVLYFVEKKNVRENFKTILLKIQASERKEYILNLGTRIFLDSNIQPQQQYAAKALEFYQAAIEPTNFTNPVDASHTINSWIDKLTNGKVPEMVKPDNLKDALMVINNAIYFKGTWRHKFSKEKTHTGGFYLTPNEVVDVSYMNTIGNFYFTHSTELDSKILRLPYKGNKYALFIILPNSKSGLSHLIETINTSNLRQCLFNLEDVIVDVSIPKFKFNYKSSFVKILKEYGLRQMFQNTASFPGIARGPVSLQRQLVVSDIIQKSGIELDEEGSEVYAATDVQIGNKFGDVKSSFNVTHPFMFFIEEQSSGTILFIGKVMKPNIVNPVSLHSRLGDDKDDGNSGNHAASLSGPNLQPENPDREVILQRFNYFDLELLHVLTESQQNVFISPASIKTTLALILEGARGKSAEEIGNALRIDDINRKEVRDNLNRLLFDVNDKGPNTLLESLNAIFVSDKLKINQKYKEKIIQFYKAYVENINFTNTAHATEKINNWVSKATHKLITEIIDNGLDPDTKLVITNSVYFKGKWNTSFDEQSTKIKCFYTANRGCVNTPLMLTDDILNYALITDLNAQAVELPYADDKYSMLVLIPAKGNNIKTLARDIQHTKFSAILDQLKPDEIIFEMPAFEVEYTADLTESLKHLKIQDIFGFNANLSGIINEDNVKVSAMLHKARIEVNEQGTKAAASTAALVIPLMGSPAQRVVADHPFIYFIYHKQSKNIIFEGILHYPSALIRSQRFY